MSHIRVQCETCQAVLRVRDAGFVGEVHACPRCGSMVLISRDAEGSTPPAKAEAVAAPARAAATPATLAMGDTLETVVPPPEPSEAAPQDAPAPEPPVAEAEATSTAATETIPAPVVTWAPIAMTVTSLIATGVIVAIWMASGSSPQATETEQPVVAAAEPNVAEPKPAAEPTPAKATPAVAEEVVDQTHEAPAEERLAEALPPERIALATPTTSPPPRPSTKAKPPVDAAPPPEEPAGEIDPLAFDPSEAVVILRKGPGLDETEDEPRLASAQPERDPPIEAAEPTLDERLAAAAQHAGVYVRLGQTEAATTPFAGSAEAALAQVVPAVALHDIPLDRSVELLGRITGAPITLDPVALRRAGVAAATPIDVVGEGLTVGQLLRQSLKPIRLAVQTDGPHATIVRQGAMVQRKVTHKLDDLVGDDPATFAETLRRLVPLQSPPTISAGGEFELTAPMATHYDLLVFAERLRLDRGLPLATKYPRELLQEDPSGRLASVLDRRTTFSFVEPTPLDDVFDHWRRVTGVSILIDWRSLADAGLGPQSTLECSVTNRPWRAALDGVLNPLGLAWESSSGGAIWITVP